jgi:hypothetical protein
MRSNAKNRSGKVVPYNEHEAKVNKTDIAAKQKGVNPVAKDTNKTRRKMVKPTSRGR